MIQTFTIEGFDPPKQQNNYHDPKKIDYSYWVSFREFGEKVLVVKQSPSLQIGQELHGELVLKTSKQGNTYYRFKNAPRDGYTPSTPAQSQEPSYVPVQNVNAVKPLQNTLQSDITRHMWGIEIAATLIAGGQGSYPDLKEMANDVLNTLDEMSQKPELLTLTDLDEDSPVKKVFSAPSATPPSSPPDFLMPSGTNG